MRVLEEQSFERVGGNEKIKVDVRIISATNKDLKHMVDKGLFREDLYYRLNAITLQVPPLRERKEDIPELVSYFLGKYLSKTGRSTSMIFSQEALSFLLEYSWPGNVRELENVVMRSMVLAEGAKIEVPDLPSDILNSRKNSDNSSPPQKLLSRVCSMNEIEKEAIQMALEETQNNATLAARLLNIGRMTFYRKAKLYSIRLR